MYEIQLKNRNFNDIEKIIQLGKEMGFFMAVTTNGTILKSIAPDRIFNIIIFFEIS